MDPKNSLVHYVLLATYVITVSHLVLTIGYPRDLLTEKDFLHFYFNQMIMIRISLFFLLCQFSHVSSLTGCQQTLSHQKTRREFHGVAFGGCLSGMVFGAGNSGAYDDSSKFSVSKSNSMETETQSVYYKSLSLPLSDFGVTIPVACWFPMEKALQSTITSRSVVKYDHRISVKRIGQLLAGWDFIPEFASRNFAFTPTSTKPLLDGNGLSFPMSSKVVFLAHGYLGSRFDLSHLAEELATQGFTVISAEYPESLAASYPRLEGLDRTVINNELLYYVKENLKPKSFAGIGHSLGCGTVLKMGDASWTRVLIAGRPPEASSSPLLFISSTNDGAVAFGGPLTIPNGYTVLDEANLPNTLPSTGALIFDRPDAPNHISYLSENVNEAMVGFLSPLLPIAQSLSIPVLDFDKYQSSRDSEETAKILKPIISKFLGQYT